jgi:hypothetical protein
MWSDTMVKNVFQLSLDEQTIDVLLIVVPFDQANNKQQRAGDFLIRSKGQ